STDEVVADAKVDCATTCTGKASSNTNAGHKSGTDAAGASKSAADAKAAATKTAGTTVPGGPESATNGKADCTVSGGGCSTHSKSGADGEDKASAGSSH